MKPRVTWVVFILLCLHLPLGFANDAAKTTPTPLQCVAFSPYVGQLNPDFGVHPPKELINELLDKIVQETPFRCIMSYGTFNGLEYIFEAAKERHIKVIAVLWIDKDPAVNSQSISTGIKLAKDFPKTIIKISCGSEVRTRNNMQFDHEIIRCIDAMREAKVKQPVTTIDTWWEWCNRSFPCAKTAFSDKVDWIGINVFPWWENRFSGLFSCTSADQAADFHLARLNDVERANPKKEVVITEFGWPNGPAGYGENNVYTGQHCGVASKETQYLVIHSTFKKLAAHQKSGVVFEAFSENWKPSNEGRFGSYWGICAGIPPYSCTQQLTH